MNSLFNGKYFRLFLLLVFALLLILPRASAQQARRGQPPPVDMHKVPKDAMEPGVVRIKLRPEYANVAKNAGFGKTEAGVVRFDLPALDKLNQRHLVKKARKTFQLKAGNVAAAVRHEKWGLPLWIDLQFEAGTDIREVVEAYGAMDEVAVAEPLYKIEMIGDVEDSDPATPQTFSTMGTPNDPGFPSQWHYNNTGQVGGTPGADISLKQAWQIEAGNPDVIVAIVDGGIQTDHPDLKDNMWSGIGYNFVTNSTTVTPHNHGTHVAGTVSAVNNNEEGLSGIAGGSGNGDGVKLMSCQVFTDNGSGGFHLALIYAADNGAAIAQNSWGYTTPGVFNQSMLDAIDYFNTNGGGEVMDGGITIFAAGNSSSSGAWYPAYYEGVVAVASTNNKDKKAWYSNYGSWVDISAPGGETSGGIQGAVYSTVTNSAYSYYQGTSMACPHVSGVAALVLSKYPGAFNTQQLRDILVHSADNHYSLNADYIGQLGSGRLNAYNALQLAAQFSEMPDAPKALQATTASSSQLQVAWKKNLSQNKVILAWSLDGVFGNPQPGTAYSQGNQIPGGGQVIYAGTSEQFAHSGLQSGSTYFYQAWSVDNELLYSVSTPMASASTLCGIINTLPYQQPFSAEAMPICWTQADNIGQGQGWQFGTFSGGVAGTAPGYAYLNSDAYGQDHSQDADLISPTFDLSSYPSVKLSFDHYFRQANAPSEGTLSYSIDNGATWTTIRKWDVTTANPSAFTTRLDAVGGHQQVKFRWNYTGSYSYYWSIDNITVTEATAESESYQLTVAQQGQGQTSPGSGTYTHEEGSQVTFSATPASGWSFDKWIINGQSHTTSDLSIAVNADTQATAVFTEDAGTHHTLTINKQGQGDTSPASGTYTYEEGSQANLTATAASGWSFDKWIINGQSHTTPDLSVAVNGDLEAIAVFKEKATYTITIEKQGQGATSPASGSHVYEGGSQVVFTATAASGWSFDKWIINGQSYSNKSLSVTVNADIQATAVFTEDVVTYTLTLEQQGQGATSPAAGTHTFADNTQLTLEATEVSGWSFSRWEINDISYDSPSLDIAIISHMRVVAVFTEDPAEFSLLLDFTGQGTINPGAGEYAVGQGTLMQLQATPAQGWVFVKWTINEVDVSFDPVISFQVDEDMQVHAYFQAATGIADDDQLTNVTIYPNPSAGRITISGLNGMDQVEVMVSDLLGRQKFYEVIKSNLGTGTYQLNLEELPMGIYIISVHSGNTVRKEKILISR
ncbi:MAG: S8 family serine peptidase [Bacteroidales bacterium]